MEEVILCTGTDWMVTVVSGSRSDVVRWMTSLSMGSEKQRWRSGTAHPTTEGLDWATMIFVLIVKIA